MVVQETKGRKKNTRNVMATHFHRNNDIFTIQLILESKKSRKILFIISAYNLLSCILVNASADFVYAFVTEN